MAKAHKKADIRKRKEQTISDISDKLSRATSVIVTDYRGATVKQIQELRSTLRDSHIDYVVVKNTLARRAAASLNMNDFIPILTGPVGLAFGYDDISLPTRLLMEYNKETKLLPSLAGIIGNVRISDADLKTIAMLPSRDILLAQLAGTLQSPLSNLAATLSSITETLARSLQAYGDSLSHTAA